MFVQEGKWSSKLNVKRFRQDSDQQQQQIFWSGCWTDILGSSLVFSIGKVKILYNYLSPLVLSFGFPLFPSYIFKSLFNSMSHDQAMTTYEWLCVPGMEQICIVDALYCLNAKSFKMNQSNLNITLWTSTSTSKHTGCTCNCLFEILLSRLFHFIFWSRRPFAQFKVSLSHFR